MNDIDIPLEFLKEIISDESNGVSASPEKKVLDLGCGYPSYFFYLLHLLHYKSLLGVDEGSKEEIVNKWQQCISPKWVSRYPSGYIPTCKWYNIYEEFVKGAEIGEPLSKEQLDDIFIIEFNKDIISFIEKTKADSQLYNLIVLRDILHFFPNDNSIHLIMDYVYKHLEANGTIYIKVASKNHNYSKQPDKRIFSLEELTALLKDYHITWQRENEKGSIIELLAKKL